MHAFTPANGKAATYQAALARLPEGALADDVIAAWRGAMDAGAQLRAPVAVPGLGDGGANLDATASVMR